MTEGRINTNTAPITIIIIITHIKRDSDCNGNEKNSSEKQQEEKKKKSRERGQQQSVVIFHLCSCSNRTRYVQTNGPFEPAIHVNHATLNRQGGLWYLWGLRVSNGAFSS